MSPVIFHPAQCSCALIDACTTCSSLLQKKKSDTSKSTNRPKTSRFFPTRKSGVDQAHETSQLLASWIWENDRIESRSRQQARKRNGNLEPTCPDDAWEQNMSLGLLSECDQKKRSVSSTNQISAAQQKCKIGR